MKIPRPALSLPAIHPALRWLSYPFILLAGGVAMAAAMMAIVAIILYPQLPSLEALTDYRPKQPLRVYTADGYLIGEFGEERRSPVRIQDVPDVMKQAILAAEDERFYQHPGVDTIGVLRAAYSNLVSGGKAQGASTITMQVARNFFLSSEKTLTRKLYEVLLSFKIEANLSKDEILQLYCNQIYLGQRAYGFAAAAQIYFGKKLTELSAAEAAMLAGLPKAPSKYNPVVNPKRAQLRQHYVLRRMHELGYIDETAWEAARAESLRVKHHGNDFGTRADYVAEMARQIAVEQYTEAVYGQGLRVVTTLVKAEQDAAYVSLRKAVMDYDRRHGYRGAESYADPKLLQLGSEEAFEDALNDVDETDGLFPALVLEVTEGKLKAYRRGGEVVSLSGDALKFAARMLDDKAPATKRLRRGAVIRVARDDKLGWMISQLPEVEAAFVAASPIDGAVRALVGGFDFNRNKFNHVTQAWRQPGSSFKPFIYSAALEKGFNAGSVIPDEPIVISAAETGSQAWEPKNYDGKYEGPMTLRTALAKSKNMVSIRLLKSIGTGYAQDYVTRFGFDADKHPPYLTMALGAGSVTPWQQLGAYAVFANGGYRIQPHIVKQIQDSQGNVLAEFKPQVAGAEELRVLDARNAYIMDSIMHDVVRRGTATRAYATLKRGDLAGKTGTTNDYIDAWFCGYQPTVVGIAWIGFDQPKRMGSGETGGAAALPIWIGYMQQALKGVPESYMETPEGLTAFNADDPSGKPAKEVIYKEHLPADEWDQSSPVPSPAHEPPPAKVPPPVPEAPVSESVIKPVVR